MLKGTPGPAKPRTIKAKEAAKPKAEKIVLDWRAYFQAFCREHGGNPVEHKGRLLFADGWAYSAHDHQGPEWPPPADPDQRRTVLLAYWGLRRKIVAREARAMEAHKDWLLSAQATRSAPLQRIAKRKDEDGKVSAIAESVSLDGLNMRLDWLRADLSACDEEIKRLKAEAGATEEEAVA